MPVQMALRFAVNAAESTEPQHEGWGSVRRWRWCGGSGHAGQMSQVIPDSAWVSKTRLVNTAVVVEGRKPTEVAATDATT